jgi:hypothetical protein
MTWCNEGSSRSSDPAIAPAVRLSGYRTPTRQDLTWPMLRDGEPQLAPSPGCVIPDRLERASVKERLAARLQRFDLADSAVMRDSHAV